MKNQKYQKAGWYYLKNGKWRKKGFFCPNCGSQLFFQAVGFRKRLICLNCDWEQPPEKIRVVKVDEKHYAIYTEPVQW
jgi:ribosomal protein S27AE